MFGQGPFIVPLPFGAEDLPWPFGAVGGAFLLAAVSAETPAPVLEVCGLLVPLEVLPVEADAPAMPIAAPALISAAPARAAISVLVGLRMRQNLLS